MSLKHKDTTLLIAIYYPKPGSEENFIQLWHEVITPLATKMGATQTGVFHNQDTDEFFTSSHWPTQETAEKFLTSTDFKKANDELNHLCLVPASRELFEILREAA